MAGFSRLHTLRSLNWRLAFIHAGALLTFALIPVWDRFSFRLPPPLLLPPELYVSRFLILMPILWTIVCWLIFGLPGFAALLRDPLRRLWALFVLLLALWVLASTEWAFMRTEHPEVGLNAAVQFAVALLFVVAVTCAGPPPRLVVAVLSVGLLWNSLLTILQVRVQGALGLMNIGEFPFGRNMIGVSVLRAGDIEFVRPYGLLPHPNLLAGALMVSLLATGGLLLSPSRTVRWIGSATLLIGLWALLLTFSRGAWGGLIVGVFAVLPLLWPYLRRPHVRLNLVVTVILALVVGGFFVATYRPLLAARALEGSESIELRSVSDRTVFAGFAERSIAERPLLGVGIGNFPWRTSYYLAETNFDLRGDNVHHVMLSAWAELGIVGLALVIAALVTGVEIVLKTLRQTSARSLPHPNEGNISQILDNLTGDRGARIALLAMVMALLGVGLLDHYPWTLLHFQVVWWGGLAIAGRPTTQS
jgi:O-antigen ligase